MRRTHGPYLSLAMLLVLACTASIGMAQAMTRFDLPGQSLADALRAVGSQAKINVLFDPPLVAGHQAPALKANLTIDQALTKLLAGTGIKYEFLNETTVVLAATSSTTDAGTAPPRPPGVQAPPSTKQIEGAGDKSALDQFRVAQADQGKSSSSYSVAQTSDQNPQKGSAQGLEEVVVTAQKKTENIQDVPVPVTAINAESLLDKNQLRLEDYYNTVPGFSVAPIGLQSTQVLAIRGINTGLAGNPSVGVTVDDVPYGSSTNAGGGTVVPDIDPGDLARVEVLRGPQGTLYGASSLGGLLKFVTLDPTTDVVSGRAQVGTSTVYNGAELGYNVRGSVNVPLSDMFAIRVSGFTHQDPGYIDNPVLHINGINESEAYGGHLSAIWRPSDAVSLKLSALYQDTKGDGSNDVNIATNGYVGPALGDLQQNYLRGIGGYGRTVEAFSATLNAKLGSVNLTAVSGYNVNGFHDSADFSYAFGSAAQTTFGVPGAPLTDNNKTNKFTQEIRLSTPIGQSFDWLFGAFYTNEKSQYTSNFLAENPSTGEIVGNLLHYTYPTTYEDYAAFTDLTFHMTDRFDVQIGGRESQIKQSFTETEIGPLLGTTSTFVIPYSRATADSFTYLVTPQFKVSPDLMAYIRLASGFRPGGVNGLVGGPVPTIPPQYDPDKTKDYEIGVKGDMLDHAVSFDASLYYIDWQNIQLSLFDPVSKNSYIANASRAKSQGVELSVESKPLTGLTISAWVTWEDAVLTAGFPPTSTTYGVPGDALPYSSRFSGNFSLDEEFHLTGHTTGFVGSTVSYVGDREGEFGGTAQRQGYPAYTETNIRAGVKADSWTYNLFVTNVFDQRGVLAGGLGSYPPFAFTYIQPRTVGLSVVKRF